MSSVSLGGGASHDNPRGLAEAVGHTHQWEHRPEQSGDQVTRYQCSACRCWAYRIWPPRGERVRPIVAYSPPRMSPKPAWSYEPPPLPRWPEEVDDEDEPTEIAPELHWRSRQ